MSVMLLDMRTSEALTPNPQPLPPTPQVLENGNQPSSEGLAPWQYSASANALGLGAEELRAFKRRVLEF